MHPINRIRTRNMLSGFLQKLEKSDLNERYILIRIGVVLLSRLRMHIQINSETGYAIRLLAKQAERCNSIETFGELWAPLRTLVEECRAELALSK